MENNLSSFSLDPETFFKMAFSLARERASAVSFRLAYSWENLTRLHDKWGFGNHFVAWQDNGQVLSWRKLKNFDYQYHIRVFKDGEIRGHYEYTPESKPLDHFIEIGEMPRLKDFKKFLSGYMVKRKTISHLKPDVNVAPESEITIDSLSESN